MEDGVWYLMKELGAPNSVGKRLAKLGLVDTDFNNDGFLVYRKK